MKVLADDLALATADGHRWELPARLPDAPKAALLWLPALGVAARHYLPFAEALAAHGIATFLHEWRGHGSSNLRASRSCDWDYRTLLETDIPASQRGIAMRLPDVPALIGGHSLGGQLSACRLALAPDSATRLWLVGSGVPFPSAFDGVLKLALPIMLRALPWLAAHRGALPGRRIGFGGREAAGVMRDWGATGRAERYAIPSLGRDLDPALRQVVCPVDAVALDGDRYAPEASLQALVDRLGGPVRIERIGRNATGGYAGHFGWMRDPAAVAATLAASIGSQ